MEGPRVKTLCAENEGPFHVSQDLIPTGVMMRICSLVTRESKVRVRNIRVRFM